MTEPTPDSTSLTEQFPQPAPQPASPLRRVFVGPSGLRAGWRFLIYVVAFVALLSLFGLALAPVAHGLKAHKASPLWTFLLSECVSFAAAVIPALLLSRFENRPFGSYGLPTQDVFRKHFWQGLAWGMFAISALLLVMRGLGAFYYGGLALHGLAILKFATFWAVLFLMVGFFEDFLFRGYTQFTLADGIGFWPAALLLSLTFGGVHLRQELALGDAPLAWAGVLAAAFIGLFFCLTLRRTGTLWFAIGFHASWDWGQTFFYAVPDSGTKEPGHLLNSTFQGNPWLTGGVVGPEGSILVFVTIAAVWIVFDRFYPVKRGATTPVESVSQPGPSV